MHTPSILSTRNKVAFLTSVLSFFFLFPGIYLSMLTVVSEGDIKANVPRIEYNFLGIPSEAGTETRHFGLHIFDTTRSILNTVHDLWDRDYYFVASMIFLFSVIIPVLKGILLTYVFFNKNPETRKTIFVFIKSIGKWSMCDVFIAAIFLAYLSTGAVGAHNANDVTVMGYAVHVNVLVGMSAKLQLGFWCFLAYCLLSLTALQLYKEY